jgi:hypothetical protein
VKRGTVKKGQHVKRADINIQRNRSEKMVQLEKDYKTLQIMPKVTSHPPHNTKFKSITKSVTSHMTIAAQPQAQIKEV